MAAPDERPAPGAIELRHLRAFVVVAEELHFGRAAARLHLSQPALSRQIAALERLVGTALLDRSTHHVALRPAGVVLLGQATTIVADVDRAVASTRAAGGGHDGDLELLEAPLAAVVRARMHIDQLRDAHEALMATLPVPPQLAVRPLQADGVPGLGVGPAGAAPGGLYLHGGGYVMGSAYGFRSLAGAVGVATGRELVVPDYRLAPEHPYPAALTDALTAYRWLCGRVGDAQRLVVVGDSSGGGLVLALLLAARAEGLPMPGHAVLISPWVDPSAAVEQAGSGWVRLFAEQYGDAVDLSAAEVNPAVDDLGGLPPLLVQVGRGDDAFAQSTALVERVRRAGGRIELQTFPVATHVFQLFTGLVPDADGAVARIGRFVTGPPHPARPGRPPRAGGRPPYGTNAAFAPSP